MKGNYFFVLLCMFLLIPMTVTAQEIENTEGIPIYEHHEAVYEDQPIYEHHEAVYEDQPIYQHHEAVYEDQPNYIIVPAVYDQNPIYHEHEGSPETGGGCYVQKTGTKQSPDTGYNVENGTGDWQGQTGNWGYDGYKKFSNGHSYHTYHNGPGGDLSPVVSAPAVDGYTTSTYTYYELGCGMTEETVVGYEDVLVSAEHEEISGYNTVCVQEAYDEVVGYESVCIQEAYDEIVGYESVCIQEAYDEIVGYEESILIETEDTIVTYEDENLAGESADKDAVVEEELITISNVSNEILEEERVPLLDMFPILLTAVSEHKPITIFIILGVTVIAGGIYMYLSRKYKVENFNNQFKCKIY